MRIERLVCTRLRNLTNLDLAFAPGVNLLVGANGQGKTNVLEAVHFFKFGRSFRTQRDVELIEFREPFGRVEATCIFDDGARVVFAASIERDGTKHIKTDGTEIERLSDLVGRYPCVLFGPGDLDVVAGAPAERRRFLDMVGSMTDAAYIRVAREYRRILHQRNASLRARASDYELNIWNEQITRAGADLILRRKALTRRLLDDLQAHARELAAPFDFAMSYESRLLPPGEAAGADGEDGDRARRVAESYAELLSASADEERRRLTTLAGPHRDDIALRLDGKDLRRYGSQGQRRLFAVLMKLAELSHLERELGERCALLLDDVFSEFDPAIMEKLQTLLHGGRQVFVTSPVDLPWAGAEGARRFRVDAGRVEA